jgi:hypothetical protein
MWYMLPIMAFIGIVFFSVFIIESEKVFKRNLFILIPIITIITTLLIIFVDYPSYRTYKINNTMLANECLKCKIQIDSSFYVIGCDNKTYTLSMIDWVNLDIDICK